jgi:hypothetical protein
VIVWILKGGSRAQRQLGEVVERNGNESVTGSAKSEKVWRRWSWS